MLVRIKHQTPEGEASRAFGNFFKAYTMAINKAFGRTGSLFETPFHRRLVLNDVYFMRLVLYIHLNPIKHGFVTQVDDWPYSSYHALKSSGSTQLCRDEVIAWFGDRQHMIGAHCKFVPEAWLVEQDFEG